MLARRHPTAKGEWVFWTEVFGIDAFAMRFWGSNAGRIRVAYEVKVSRSDFLAELRKPAKRQLGMALSHEFYFAVPKGLVSVEEVPADCGLVEMAGTRSKVARKAPRRVPRWFSEDEVRSLLRRDLFHSGRDALAGRVSMLELSYKALRDNVDRRVEDERTYIRRRLQRALEEQGLEGMVGDRLLAAVAA